MERCRYVRSINNLRTTSINKTQQKYSRVCCKLGWKGKRSLGPCGVRRRCEKEKRIGLGIRLGLGPTWKICLKIRMTQARFFFQLHSSFFIVCMRRCIKVANWHVVKIKRKHDLNFENFTTITHPGTNETCKIFSPKLFLRISEGREKGGLDVSGEVLTSILALLSASLLPPSCWEKRRRRVLLLLFSGGGRGRGREMALEKAAVGGGRSGQTWAFIVPLFKPNLSGLSLQLQVRSRRRSTN